MKLFFSNGLKQNNKQNYKHYLHGFKQANLNILLIIHYEGVQYPTLKHNMCNSDDAQKTEDSIFSPQCYMMTHHCIYPQSHS